MTAHTIGDLIPQARADALAESWALRGPVARARTGWHEHAECLGCRTFTVELCADCRVRLDCLAAAYQEETGSPRESITGIRGGLHPHQRLVALRPKTANCGTNAGYHRHVKLREPTCEDCRRAHRAYRKARRKAA